MEGKPDWLPGFPVQIYCNRSDLIYRLNAPDGPSAYKRTITKNNEKGEQPESAPGNRAADCSGFCMPMND